MHAKASVIVLTMVIAGCSTVQSGVSDLKDGFGRVASRIDAALRGPTELYNNLTDEDVEIAVRAMQVAMETKPTGEAVDWTNPTSGNAGAFTPRRTFITDRGIFCRDYEEKLEVGERSGVVNNTACRSEDGVWTWVS
ncbi:MAG: RT0821/Lpp0805 family surface protein [Alphaproteobacteria bacterium]